MIPQAGVDTSTFIEYFAGGEGADLDLLDELLRLRQAVMIPPVLTELLSSTRLPEEAEGYLRSLPSLPLLDGFWSRAGALRRAQSGAPKLAIADALIAQFCIDHRLPLLTRDRDFDPLADATELKLIRT